MSRREIYRRTKGYSIYGVGIAALFAVMLLVSIITGIRKGPIDMWGDALFLAVLCGAVVLLSILYYWKHWLDIFKKDLVLFEGEVLSEGPIAGSQMESAWENWRLAEKGKDVPQRFFICLRQMKKQYQNHALIPDMCRGPVSFLYLKRTKCIVEIVRVSTPKQDTRSKHAQKKARRKAQYQQPPTSGHFVQPAGGPPGRFPGSPGRFSEA